MLNKLSSRLRRKHAALPPATAAQAASLGNHNEEEDDVVSIESFAESLFPVEDQTQTLNNKSSLSFSSSVSVVSSSSAESRRSWNSNWPGGAAAAGASPAAVSSGTTFLPEYEQAEEDFLEANEDYFEHLEVDNLRSEYYPSLVQERIVHLDYAAAPLTSTGQAQEQGRLLLEEAVRPMSSRLAAQVVMERATHAKERLLRMLNTSEMDYSLSFSSSLAAAFTAATSYQRHRQLLVCQDTHPAIRQCIMAAHKQAELLPVRAQELCIAGREMRTALLTGTSRLGLFVLPAQSGVSGTCYSFNWVAEAQQNGWLVLLDISHYWPASGKLDLELHQPDFVIGSLHHIAGTVAPEAFLLVKNGVKAPPPLLLGLDEQDSETKARSIQSMATGLAALNYGLEQLESVLGLARVWRRLSCISSWLRAKLESMRHHQEDRQLVKMYGRQHSNGSMLVFNLLDSTGNLFPASIVQSMAEGSNIILGSCHLHSLLHKQAQQHFTALRISLGFVSNFEDAYRFLLFVLRFRDEDYMSLEALCHIEDKSHTPV